MNIEKMIVLNVQSVEIEDERIRVTPGENILIILPEENVIIQGPAKEFEKLSKQ